MLSVKPIKWHAKQEFVQSKIHCRRNEKLPRISASVKTSFEGILNRKP